MLNIFICDDEPQYLTFIKKQVDNYVTMSDFAMRVVCASTSPLTVLKHLEENPRETGLYFLDLHLNSELDGIQLAEAIRRHDPRGFIVFITSDAAAYKLAFKYKVEAMDYIVKDELDNKARINECLDNAVAKLSAQATPLQDHFVFKIARDIKLFRGKSPLSKDSTISIDKSKILCFMTEPENKRMVKVYTTEGQSMTADNLKSIEAKMNSEYFYRCQNNLIVNLDKCVALDIIQNLLFLTDGLQVEIKSRNIKTLNARIAAHRNKQK